MAMLVSDSTSGSEMDEAAVKKTPRRGPENGESNAQALIQRLQPNELQGRRIRLYRNGDRFFKVYLQHTEFTLFYYFANSCEII